MSEETRDYRHDTAPEEFVYIYADSNGGLALSTSGFTTSEDGAALNISPALLRQVAAKLIEIAGKFEAARDG